jgi:hypothetical protein
LCSQLEAFGCQRFREFIVQFLLRLPEGGRRLTLNNLSFIFVALTARLTFAPLAPNSNVPEYGCLDDRVYTQSAHWSFEPRPLALSCL